MNIKPLFAVIIVILFCGCIQKETNNSIINRYDLIPSNATKITPETDIYPPILYSNNYETPVPLPFPVNTAGGEDSPFYYNGSLYYFFTPIVNQPLEVQLNDGATGIYITHKNGTGWTEPVKLILNEPGKLSLDGCEFVINNTLWFCSAREGYTGIHWFTSEIINDVAMPATLVPFPDSYEVGELHIYGNELYFHSSKPKSKGDYDIWMSYLADNEWTVPVNVEAVNSEVTDGWPYISSDGLELWFLRWHLGTPAIMKSVWNSTGWAEPELIVSQFAGEPTFDEEGNLYFVHHYYNNSVMIEADIYVAYKK
jgi:hypothetical protein